MSLEALSDVLAIDKAAIVSKLSFILKYPCFGLLLGIGLDELTRWIDSYAWAAYSSDYGQESPR